MTKLSVNINKIATLRNARGGNTPNLIEAAIQIQNFGAEGITVHPRPDQRHITYKDVLDLKSVITTEFNIEGYPSEKFITLVEQAKPMQVTLVPDPPEAITSNAGWDTKKHKVFLSEITQHLQSLGCRVSLFMETKKDLIEIAKEIGTNRIELYTESYAKGYLENKTKAIQPFIEASEKALEIGLELNAGHDLNLYNIGFFTKSIPQIMEVSIGHALISDALYYGLENTVQMYKRALNHKEQKLENMSF